MKAKSFTKENVIRYSALYTALLFCLFTLVFFSILRENGKAFMSLVSFAYVFAPGIAEKLFKFRIQPTLYVFIIFYTVCPLLGYAYNFYYNLPWWDDILHAFAGVIFAMFGAYLPKVMNKDKEVSLAVCAFSAFFFSVAIAGLWELIEFSVDSFFGTDMQKDTELFDMRPSYLLSELLGFDKGVLGEIHDVTVLINGEPIQINGENWKGYIDVGLIDSMKDIFVETLGAVVYLIIFLAGNGKNFVFERLPDTETEPLAESLPVGAAELAVSEATGVTSEKTDESAESESSPEARNE